MHTKVQPLGMSNLHRRQMPQMSKTARLLKGKQDLPVWVVLTHNDGDALGCISVLEETIKPKKYFYTNYADLEPQLQNLINYVKENKVKNVLIADVSLSGNRETLITLVRTLKKISPQYSLKIFDHHLYPENYWNGVQAEVHYNSDKSACRILFDYFSKQYNLYNLISIIDILNTFDTWDKENPKFLDALIFNEFFLGFRGHNYARIMDFFYLLRANGYQYTFVMGDFKRQLIEEYQVYREDAQNRGILQHSKTGTPITVITSWEYFNLFVYYEHKNGQDVVVGIKNGVFRVRVRGGSFTDPALEKIRKELCGTSDIGHNLAFTYRIPNFTNSEDVVQEIKRLTKVFNTNRIE